MNVQEAITEASQQFGISLKEKQFEAIYKLTLRHSHLVNDPLSLSTPINNPGPKSGRTNKVTELHQTLFSGPNILLEKKGLVHETKSRQAHLRGPLGFPCLYQLGGPA